MANIVRWGTPALTTVLSTELNSIGSTAAISSSAFDNTTSKYLYCDIELFLAAFSPVLAPFLVTIYFFPSIDATNFSSATQPDLTQQQPMVTVNIPIGTTASTAQRIVARHIPLVPVQFKVALVNSSTNFAASGNTVKLLTYGQNLNG